DDQTRGAVVEQVDRLEQQNTRSGSGGVDQVNQAQALQSQVQALQGQIEELKFQLGEMQRRSKDQYIDLDTRLGRLEGGAPRGSVPTPLAPVDQGLQDIQLGDPSPESSSGTLTPADAALIPPSGEPALRTDAFNSPAPSMPEPTATDSTDPAAEKGAYDEAFASLKDGRYAESARRFQSFTEKYPNSDLAGNAYYWLGESYYVTQNYRVALETFNTLLARFPANQKAPDALLKTGYCQYELKLWDDAEKTLTDVTVRYPETTVSRLAQGRLRALKLESRR
ncbi:MAG: tol-pal system protein YbgF, partial [Dokdonella sp.]